MMNQAQQTLPIGTKIAVYQIQEVIHHDSASITYRAWNQHLNASVAIVEYFPLLHAKRDADQVKVSPKTDADKSLFEVGMAIFLEQCEILLSTQHRNIIEAHNVLEFNHTAYCIINDAKGTPLATWFSAHAPVPTERLKSILRSLMGAILTLQEQGTAHADVHAENILMLQDDVPLLTHFAVTRLAIAARNKSKQQELRPGYAAPELYQNNVPADALSDIYALGALMYAMVMRQHPVSGLSRREALDQGQDDPLPSLAQQTQTEYSNSLLATIDAMLSLERRQRPQSLQELERMLQQTDDKDKEAVAEFQQQDSEVAVPGFYPNGLLATVVVVILVFVIFFYSDKEDHDIDVVLEAEQYEETDLDDSLINQPAAENSALAAAQPAAKEEQVAVQSGVLEAAVEENNAIDEQANASASLDQDTVDADTSSASEIQEVMTGTEQINLEASTEALDQAPEVVATLPEQSALQPENVTPLNPVSDQVTEEPDAQPVEPVQEQIVNDNLTESVEPIAVEVETAELPPSVENEKTIQKNLAAAKARLAEFKLTTPDRDNAYYYYQQILAIEPDHSEAQAGMQQLVEIYIQYIENSIAKRRWRLANVYLDRAEMIAPNSAKLAEISQRLRVKP